VAPHRQAGHTTASNDSRRDDHFLLASWGPSTHDRKFAKHYVKLDYRETDSRGTGAAKKFTLPWSNAKSLVLPGILGKLIHREARYQTPDKINRDAMRESLANDLMRSFGIFAQKLKLVPTEYADGTPKLLLDGTHMSGPNGEKFSDFEGAIKNGPKNGQLVKLDGEGNPVKNARGHYEVDTSIRGPRPQQDLHAAARRPRRDRLQRREQGPGRQHVRRDRPRPLAGAGRAAADGEEGHQLRHVLQAA
jgi:hypothetical protein